MQQAFEARVKSLMTDVPDLPNFSHFHDAFRRDAGKQTNEGDMRSAFFAAYNAEGCEYIPLRSPEIDKRLKDGPDLVSANFVIPYPPGFPIMVPGQVITQETIDFMRKLDVKEIHGYDAPKGLKLVRTSALACGRGAETRRVKRSRRETNHDDEIVGGLQMAGFFQFLQNNPYLLLFLTVGLAVWIGRVNIKGYGLGMVAGAIVVGAALSVWASAYGTKLELNNFAKSLFYYLFMYGVGLRVGPSFINSLGGDGLKFSLLAVVSCVLGLAIVVMGAKLFDLPPGAAGGMLAGSQTMSAAIGSAEQAAYVIRLPAGVNAGGRCLDGRPVLRHHLHLGHGRHHPDLQVSAALVGHRRARRRQRNMKPSSASTTSRARGLTGFRPFGLRAYRLENAADGRPEHRELPPDPSRIPDRQCGARRRGARRRSIDRAAARRRRGAGRQDRSADRQDGPDRAGSRGPARAQCPARPGRNPRHQQGRRRQGARVDSATSPFAGQVQVGKYERGGVPFPAGLEDASCSAWTSSPSSASRAPCRSLPNKFGRIARPSTATDLLTLSRRHDPRLPDRHDRVSGVRIARLASAMPAACCCPA